MTTPSMGPGDRNVVIGRDVIKSIVITGDLNKIFVGDYEPLRDAYIEPWSVFERVNLDHFVGREWLLREIDAFLDNNRGYFLLEAKAGLGKTALLAWLTQKRGYIHHFAELAPGLAGVETGLRNLAAQLVLAYLSPSEVEGVLPGAAARPDYLLKLLRQAAEKRLDGEKIVLVVDALDEAGTPPNQNVLGLPQVLPEGVFFIVSKRPVPVTLHVETPETPRRIFELVANSRENQADIRSFLERVASWPRIRQALKHGGYTSEQFTNTLMEKCQGVWIYLHYVVREIERGERSPLDLDTLPDGMTQYYARYWKRWRDEDEDQWYKIYLPLMTTLAAVREAVTAERLAEWANVKMRAERLRRLLSERWRHFIAIVSRGQQTRYQFYHATLHDFCEGRVEWEKLTTDEQEFVDELKQATIYACRRIMRNAQEPEVRRDAAFRLTDMDWLAYAQDVYPDEMLVYLELIGGYADSPAQRRYFVQHTSSMLDSEAVHLSERHRTQLLVYRAINLGYLGELDGAERDYKEAEPLIRELIDSKDSLLEDQKVSARVNLGLGNITRFRAEKLTKPEELERRQEGLQRAVDRYLVALESAQVYGQDAILEATMHKELSYTHALLQNWTEAEESYRGALKVLESVKDQEAYEIYYARILETASQMHFEKGQNLTFAQCTPQALSEYETAYNLVQEEFALLKPYGESYDLALAHINAGDYLCAMSECPGCPVPDALAEACTHWRTAMDMARRLGISELEEWAKERLDQHCQDKRKIRQGEWPT